LFDCIIPFKVHSLLTEGKEFLYLVMEYLPGGDLFSVIKKFGYFDEPIARQYICNFEF
jgi:serine/threonine protein kinase